MISICSTIIILWTNNYIEVHQNNNNIDIPIEFNQQLFLELEYTE